VPFNLPARAPGGSMAQRVLFHVTGFGPFGGGEVTRNPTQVRARSHAPPRLTRWRRRARLLGQLAHGAEPRECLCCAVGAQELAEALPAALAAGKCGGPLPVGAALASPCVVLTTAGRAATAQLAALPLPAPLVAPPAATPPAATPPAAAAAAAAALDPACASVAPPPVVCVVHLGVHSGASCFHLERCAWNDASFRYPDEAGWQPQGEAVVSCEALGRCRATRLPVDALVQELRAEGHACQASDDPGRCVQHASASVAHACSLCASPASLTPLRHATAAARFVCNFVYYTSLARAEAHALPDDGAGSGSAALHASSASPLPPPPPAWHALFLHVPPAHVVPIDAQLRFLAALLGALARHLLAAAHKSSVDDAAHTAAPADAAAASPPSL
jgi:hypothetical protein